MKKLANRSQTKDQIKKQFETAKQGEKHFELGSATFKLEIYMYYKSINYIIKL